MSNYDLKQAVKAYITQELEELYNIAEKEAYFAARLDERVMLLQYLQNTNRSIAEYIEISIEYLVDELVRKSLSNQRRSLVSVEENIIDGYIDTIDSTPTFLDIVSQCKQIINLK